MRPDFIRRALLPGCLALTCSLVAAQNDWFPFTLPWDDDEKTFVDASHLLLDYPGRDPETVIDSRGHIRAGGDGRFYYERTGRRARFWGVNLVFNANFPDFESAEKLARRLAKLGFNVVRCHHMDFFAAPNGIFDPRYFPHSTRHFDPDQVRRWDHLVHQLRRNGIYVNVNLKVARHFGPGDGVLDTHRFSENRFYRGVSHDNRRMIELQEDFYYEVDSEYFVGMRRYLREELGMRALVTGTAPWWSFLGDIAVQAQLDFVDGHYSLAGNSVKTAQMPIASRIFLGSQSSPSPGLFEQGLQLDEVFGGYGRGLVNSGDFLDSRGFDRASFLERRLRVRFSPGPKAPLAHRPSAQAVGSDHGELLWDRSDPARTFVRVSAEAVEGAVGFIKGRHLEFPGVDPPCRRPQPGSRRGRPPVSGRYPPPGVPPAAAVALERASEHGNDLEPEPHLGGRPMGRLSHGRPSRRSEVRFRFSRLD
jgi:hypothetical protein